MFYSFSLPKRYGFEQNIIQKDLTCFWKLFRDENHKKEIKAFCPLRILVVVVWRYFIVKKVFWALIRCKVKNFLTYGGGKVKAFFVSSVCCRRETVVSTEKAP